MPEPSPSVVANSTIDNAKAAAHIVDAVASQSTIGSSAPASLSGILATGAGVVGLGTKFLTDNSSKKDASGESFLRSIPTPSNPGTSAASVAAPAAEADVTASLAGNYNPFSSNYLQNGFGQADKLLGQVMGGATAVASLYGLFASFKSIASGEAGIMSYAGAVLSAYGAYGSMVPLLQMMGMSGVLAPYVAIAIIVLAIIMGLLKGKKKDQSEGAGDAAAFPITQTANPDVTPSWLGSIPGSSLIFLTSGMALMSMGINLTSSAPQYQTLNVPAISLPAMHRAFETASGRTLPNSLVGDVFLLRGTGNESDHAIIVSPGESGGNTLQVVTLDPNGNLVGAAAPNTGYKPFFKSSSASPTGLTPNPDAVAALSAQKSLVTISGSSEVDVKSRSAALHLANAANKTVTPAGSQQ